MWLLAQSLGIFNSMTTKQYYPEIDVIKGIAILLVILGHSFCSFPMNVGAEFPRLGYLVRSFQMPLFFIASGFLFSVRGTFGEFLNKKTKRLVIPFFVFAFLAVALKYIFSSFTRSGAVDLVDGLYDIVQGHHYWFLYSLMWIMVAVRLIKIRYVLIGLSAVSVALCVTTPIHGIGAWSIGRTIYYFPFFVLGYCLRPAYGRLVTTDLRTQVAIILSLGILYAISVLCKQYSFVALYAVTILGSLTTWYFTCLITKHSRCAVLKHFGKYSLQYYLNHLLIMLPIYYAVNQLITPPILQLLTIWSSGVLFSWTMLLIEKKFKFTRFLCGIS